jgi:hypothetical protein
VTNKIADLEERVSDLEDEANRTDNEYYDARARLEDGKLSRSMRLGQRTWITAPFSLFEAYTDNAVSGISAGSTDIVMAKAFLQHPSRELSVRAGANVVVTQDAQGFVVASTGGAAAVDDMNNVLAGQVYGG